MNININDILEQTKKNGGLTIDKKAEPIKEKNGFMVSLYGKEKIYKLSELKNDILEEFKSELINYIESLNKSDYVGLWIDNGFLYLDISKHYKDKKQAIKQGIKNKQLSIYDIKNDESIELLKKCYIVYKYDSINNDYIYIKEFVNYNDILKKYNIYNYNTLRQYITDSIENVKKLMNDKYIIVKDYYNINEF